MLLELLVWRPAKVEFGWQVTCLLAFYLKWLASYLFVTVLCDFRSFTSGVGGSPGTSAGKDPPGMDPTGDKSPVGLGDASPGRAPPGSAEQPGSAIRGRGRVGDEAVE